MAEFNESDHPRDADGKFAPGGQTVNVYSALTEAEDKGGLSSVMAKAQELFEAQPELAALLNATLADLGYTNTKFETKGSIAKEGGSGEHITSEVEPVPRRYSWVPDDKIKMARSIQSMVEGTYGENVGIRVIPEGQEARYRPGKVLTLKSSKWVNGIPTRKKLDGISTAAVHGESLENTLDSLHSLGVLGRIGPNGFYIGNKIALIQGDFSEGGEDAGESVIRNGKVLGTWDLDTTRSDSNPALPVLNESDSIGPTRAAGVMTVTGRDGKALFLQRSAAGDHAGEWCFPGGKIEPGETAQEAALRETVEETAVEPAKVAEWTRRIAEGVDFTTFITKSESEFAPAIDAEHTAWTWAPVNDPPEPLHPGARVALNRLSMDELGIARAMAAGDLVSPQKYENLWLFAIRITGTGASYRSGLDEHVWRAPEVYLNDEFLARCNGLAVVWIHPKRAMLDSDEFAKRVIGTCFLPYIANDDGIQNPEGQSVWSIAKIYDEKAAGEMQSRQISTSPGVVFRDPSVNTKVELEDGRTLLIEGKPALLDHIAVVDLGVWDKGGPATGILNNSLTERNDLMAEENPRLDADGGNIDKLLSRLDEVVGKAMKPVMDRMDAMEMADKARRDAECEKARADAQGRRDAEREEWAKADAEGCARDDAEEASEAEAMEKAGEPKEVAADKARGARKDRMKARRDAAESEAEKTAREDSARRDAEETARKDADARAERARADAIAADSRRIADALANMPKSMNDADYAAMADAQQVYDPAYQAFGQRARAPMQGEDLLAYRRSLARGLQKHSPDWKGVDLHALPDAALSIAENRIRADAVVASRSTDDLPDGELFPIRRTNESGHQITEFRGRTTIFKQFTPPHKRVTKFLTERRA